MDLKILSKFDLKQKIAISIVVFLVFVFIIIYFTILPSVKDILIIKNDIYAQKLDLEMKYQKGQNLRSLTEKLIRAEERIGMLDQAFVSGDDDLKFITTLEGVADNNNVSHKINLSKTDETGNVFSKVPIQFISQGSVINQLNYLVDLETLNFYININSLEITSAAKQLDGSQFKNVSMFMSADTYWNK